MLRSAGVCTLEARQPGNASYRGTARRGLFVVVRAAQTISFLDAPPAGAVVGGRHRLEARATSGLAVAVSSLTPDVCTLAGPNVRTIGVGRCTIGADQAGNDAFEPAAPCSSCSKCSSLTPGRARRPLCSARPRPRVRWWVALPISCRPPRARAYCRPQRRRGERRNAPDTGNRITFIGEGTCTVGAGQSGGHGFLAAPPVSQSILVARAPQAVSFLSTPPASAVAGLTTYLVVASPPRASR